MTTSTALVPTPPAPVVERYLARVAMLRPAEWGRLDAAGQRLAAPGPIARWQRARMLGAFAGWLPLFDDALTVFSFTFDTIMEVGERLSGRTSLLEIWHLRPIAALPPDASPAVRQLFDAVARLFAIADARPGGQGRAIVCLSYGLMALHLRGLSSSPAMATSIARSVVRLYAPVEPVIPLASL